MLSVELAIRDQPGNFTRVDCGFATLIYSIADRLCLRWECLTSQRINIPCLSVVCF